VNATHAPDSRYAWTRLMVTLLAMTIGSSAMYVVSVVLPAVQSEFRVARADASMPYTAMMIGFGLGGIWMGRLADRHGVMRSLLIGLFQGGIVPSYATIVREHFPPAEAGARVGTVIMFTLFGMALGGWMSGRVFDLTGSYQAAFVNGIAWNLLNLSIAVFLLRRTLGGRPAGPVQPA